MADPDNTHAAPLRNRLVKLLQGLDLSDLGIVPQLLATLLSLGFGMAALGGMITFVPGAECRWFLIVATLSLPGLFIPRMLYRVAATALLIWALVAARDGYRHGIRYREWLQTNGLDGHKNDPPKGESREND